MNGNTDFIPPSDDDPISSWAPAPATGQTPSVAKGFEGDDDGRGDEGGGGSGDGGSSTRSRSRSGQRTWTTGQAMRLAGLAVLVPMLALGGCVFWYYRTVIGPFQVVDDTFEAMAHGDIDEALALVSTAGDCNAAATLTTLADRGHRIETHFFNSLSTGSSNEWERATASGTVVFTDGRVVHGTVVVVKTDDQWKICQVDITE